MANKRAKDLDSRQLILRCKACGNGERFLEIMAFESHVVNGDLIYLGLADAAVEKYLCCDCGRVVNPRLIKRRTRLARSRATAIQRVWPSLP
jgi:hypothetical protein